ncbi:hypothetical protein M8J76_004736 [Diaphorina citri]|nr:hypothetical protein M8J75_015925 [Diaphorina citri]KAI5744731.1 hypothetical protein M8J76_004736 [Diaphorina citri]KAI5753175.1 hypothetical protein M8J77_024297 [Diaphorina citri]
MSTFKLEPAIVHGISTDIPNSVHFLSDEEVLYPSGGVLTIHNIPEKSQKFIHIKSDPDKVVNLIAVHPEKTFVAISSTAPKPVIEIYSVLTRKLVKTIVVVAPTITMCYSWDGDHLLYVTSETDPVMYYFSFELDKVESSTVATQPPAYLGPVAMIAGNPADSMIVVIVGSGLFRLLNLSDSVWRQYGFQKAEMYNFLSVSWISAERLIAGTSDGRIILVDSGELKGIYKAYDADVIMPASSKEQLQTMINNTLPKGSTTANQKSIIFAVGFPKGFSFVIAPNTVIVFEKESDKKYVKKKEFFTRGEKIRNVSSEEIDKIFSLAVSSDQNTVICCTFRAQLYSANLSWNDPPDPKNKVPFAPLGQKLHYGEVKTLATCVWKSLIMTSGLVDRRVCLFNYEKNNLIFSQYFNNDIHCLVFHPTGLFCVIASTDICQIAYIMMDKLAMGKTLSGKMEGEDYTPIRSCKVMGFSTYGTILAVADGVHIKLYDYIQFHLMYILQGHRMEITSFKWLSNDSNLISCGLDGAVYMWDVKSGKRVADVVTRHCQHHDIEATSDGKLIYTVGKDGHLKEIKNEVVIQDLEVTTCSLNRIVMSRNDQIVVISDERGLVLVVNYPVVQKVDYEQYCVHTTAVTHMRLTYENTLLITCDRDGVVCIWKILNADNIPLAPPKNVYRCAEIFISEDELTEKTDTISNLQARIKEIEFEQKFKIKELYKSHEDRMKKLKSEKESTIMMLNENITMLVEENKNQVSRLTSEKKEMSEKYEKELDAIEKHLKYKLLVRECEKSKSLEETIDKMVKTHEDKLQALKIKCEEEMKTLKEENAKKLATVDGKVQGLLKRVEQEVKNQDLMKAIVEEDADRTIIEMQNLYESVMAEESKAYVKLKYNVGVCKEVIKAMEKDIQNGKVVKAKLEETIKHLESQNLNSESRIEELVKEIIERDNILIPKERRVHFMKLKAEGLKQELQIMKMKNAELEKKIKPKDEEIAELDETMKLLKEEIVQKEHEIKQMTVKTRYLEEGINAKNITLDQEIQRQRELKALITKMKSDIYDVHEKMKDLNPDELKAATQKLYDKYGKGKTVDTLVKELRTLACENLQQRQHLDNTIKGLKRQLEREKAVTCGDKLLLQEEMQFQNCNNSLRRVYKQRVDKLDKIQEKLGDTEKATLIRDKVQTITEENAKIHAENQKRIEELEATARKLHEELFEVQKQIFTQKRHSLESKALASVTITKPS